MNAETSTPITLPDFKNLTQDQLMMIVDLISGLAEQGIKLIDSTPRATAAETLEMLKTLLGTIGYRCDLTVTDVDPGVDLKTVWGLRAAA